jgi:hypothetical protein
VVWSTFFDAGVVNPGGTAHALKGKTVKSSCRHFKNATKITICS